jgi:hypothetical protein
MPASDRASALEMRDKRIWRVPLDPLLAALKADAEGREYSAPPDEWLATDEIRAEADRWMRETGKTAAELSAIMERVARLDARTVDLGDPEIALVVGMAADDLQAAAHEGRVVARGRAACRPDDPRDEIPAKWFDEQREIDPFGTLRGPGGKGEWTDVQFRTEDVLREWPEGREPAPAAAPAAEAWMLAEAEQEYAAKGQMPKRDVIVRDCMRKTGCSWAEALAAWNELPGNLRRRRGETNRAIARRRRAAAG